MPPENIFLSERRRNRYRKFIFDYALAPGCDDTTFPIDYTSDCFQCNGFLSWYNFPSQQGFRTVRLIRSQFWVNLELDVKTSFEAAYHFIDMAENRTMIGETIHDGILIKRGTDGLFHYSTNVVVLDSPILKLVIREKDKHHLYSNPHVLKELHIQ